MASSRGGIDDEDRQVKEVMQGGEDHAVMRRIKKLENKVDRMGKAVLDLFKKYDEQI